MVAMYFFFFLFDVIYVRVFVFGNSDNGFSFPF